MRNSSFQGIDYTFRHTLNNLLNNNNPQNKPNNNNNKNQDEDLERKRRKNSLKIQQHISDLENTVLINQECINKMIPSLGMNETEKNKLLSNMNKILNYFNEKKKIRKKINEINSKMLINKQIIEEIKRRRDEGYLMYKDQISNLSESVTKNKQFQKKFSEVEIFVQRECQTEEHVEKYGKWKTFTVIPFMKKNEDILKKKCFYEEQVNNKKKNIENLENENNSLKEKDKNINNKIIEENSEMNNINECYDKIIELNKKKVELMKCRLNIISDINFKKSIIPTFKSKNPISNLDIDINLFDPKEEEKKNEIEEDDQELAPPEDDNWLDPENEGNISDIEIEK